MRSLAETVLSVAPVLLLMLLLGVASQSTLLSLISYDSLPIRLDDDVVLTTNTSWLATATDWLTVDVSGVETPRDDDWIGVFASADSTQPAVELRSAPIKYKFANASERYRSQGLGSYQFSIVNPRCDVVIAFVRNGFEKAASVAALSTIVRFRRPNEPQFPRWSLATPPDTFRLSWVSGQNDNDAAVYWSRQPDRFDAMAHAEVTRFSREQMCGPPASGIGWHDPGYIYSALVDGVATSDVIYYRFGSASAGFSKVMQFRAPPAVGETVRFYAYGDMGSGQVDGSLNSFVTEQESLATSSLMATTDFAADFVLHIGDISYAVGYLAQWDYFLSQIAPVASSMPYQTAIGNHEREFPGSGGLFNRSDSGGECGVPYSYYFPTPEGVSVSRPWYSFDAGVVHVAVMSGEDEFGPGSAQYAFLKQDLASVDRQKTPWVVLAGHRPMYCDSTWNEGPDSDGVVAGQLRSALEGLIYDAGVDLAIWGHNHSYQRSCPVFNETCVEGKGPVHVIVGTAGFFLSNNANPVPPGWLQKRIDGFGISRITASPSELRFEFVLSDDGSVADSVVLNRINVATA